MDRRGSHIREAVKSYTVLLVALPGSIQAFPLQVAEANIRFSGKAV